MKPTMRPPAPGALQRKKPVYGRAWRGSLMLRLAGVVAPDQLCRKRAAAGRNRVLEDFTTALTSV